MPVSITASIIPCSILLLFEEKNDEIEKITVS
jgi:hypothetical protein